MSTEWRAYVRVDEMGHVVLEMDERSYAEFCSTMGHGYGQTEHELGERQRVVIKPRSDETTLPGVKR